MILRHLTVDGAYPYRQAMFWSKTTGWPVSNVDEPDDDEVLMEAPSPVPGMLFIQVPEGRARWDLGFHPKNSHDHGHRNGVRIDNQVRTIPPRKQS